MSNIDFNFEIVSNKVVKPSTAYSSNPNRGGGKSLDPMFTAKQARTTKACSTYLTPDKSVAVTNLYGIVVCVNYSDYFKHSLASCVGLFKKLYVVTDNSDEDTVALCRNYDFVEVIRTNSFYDNGSNFDKGAGLNLGIKKVPRNIRNWLLIFDADIVFPAVFKKYINTKSLNAKTLYGAVRHFATTSCEFEAYEKSGQDFTVLTHAWSPRGTPIGYFQLFNSLNLKNYPEGHNNASHSDLIFSRFFKKRTTLKSIRVVHLGLTNINWDGRCTPTWGINQNSTGFYVSSDRVYNTDSGKINLSEQVMFTVHRSGWNYAVDALKPLHNDNGVEFDGFIEHRFAWKLGLKQSINEDWVGFVHFPKTCPTPFGSDQSCEHLFLHNDNFKESAKHCRGLFTLSESHASVVKEFLPDMNVCSLLHPTETPVLKFTPDAYFNNPEKRIIQIGWWLRKVSSIFSLPISKGLIKTRLVPNNNNFQTIERIIKWESTREAEYTTDYKANTETLIHVSDEKYDSLLSNNIVFVHLYDSSANNAVIECMVRNTPILVNPLPSVVEYLGPDYPFYFETLEEAAEKALNPNLVVETHNYLKEHPTTNLLTQDHFKKSFEESYIYKQL